MEKILVPTDLSGPAENAAKLAADIARWTGATLYLLHVMEGPSRDRSRAGEYGNALEGTTLKKEARERFKKFKKRSFFDGVRVITSLQYDRPYQNIVQEAEDQNVDLIVMGSHGASGLKEWFIGSNTERVIRMASCPVLTVKDAVEGKHIEDIVFASHFGDEDHEAFRRIKELAELFEAKIHLLQVNTPHRFKKSDRNKAVLEHFAAHFDLEHFTTNLYNDRSIEEGILHFSEEVGGDLIAIPTHGRKGLAHLMYGSLAEDVANHSGRCVLSVRLPER